MRKFWLYLSILIIIVLLVWVIIHYTSQSYRSQNNASSIDPILPSIKEGEQIIKHKYYTIGYNPKYKEADWVAYKLTSDMVSGSTKRTNDFRVDPHVIAGSSEPDDYKNSGYDRGHLCPTGDMKYSYEAMTETFFMSNISPQEPSFNRGIWEKLEEKVREWAKEYNELYITTGPVVSRSYSVIGKDNIAVPSYFYKVVLDYKNPDYKGIGFILENKGSNRSIESYALSIDSVESFTGLDFFSALPDSVEQAIEGSYDYNKW